MKQKKRFIAGATCPQCKTADALQWWMENRIELVECVECGFHEQRKPKSLEQSQHANEQMIGIFKPE